MISGTVLNRRIHLRVSVASPSGERGEFDAALDTGFTGYLTLPPEYVSALNLPFLYNRRVKLGHGRTVFMPDHQGQVEWHGESVAVDVLASGGSILVGMSLLYGSDVHFAARNGGPLTIVPSGTAND